MSWQPGSGWPDPRASDVDADHPPVKTPHPLYRYLGRCAKAFVTLGTPANAALARVRPTPGAAPWTRLQQPHVLRRVRLLQAALGSRRALVGAASALLLLAAFFLPSLQPAPGFSRELISDDPGGHPAAASQPTPGADRGPTPSAGSRASAGERDLSSLLKPPGTATPGPKLEPLPGWVQSVRETTLWSRKDNLGTRLLTVPENSHLQVLGQAENGRLPVYLDRGQPNPTRLGGWVELGDVKPSDQPPRVMASSRGGSRATPDISTPEKFIAAVAEAARESQLDSKVPASVTVAQAILESDWGKSQLAKKANNFFGIKATSGPGPAGVIRMDTWEVLGGQNVVVRDGFKAYHNLWESVMDHGRFLADNSRYAPAFKVLNDAREFARRIHAAGYATDPAYASKLINLMNKFNLYQYDLPQP